MPSPAAVLLQLLLVDALGLAAAADASSQLCAATRASTNHSWVNGQLVAHWQSLASAKDAQRLGSVLTRPLLAAALHADPALIPKAQPLPKEVLRASVHLNAVTSIDEKGSFFEGDGELVRHLLGFSSLSLSLSPPHRSVAVASQRLTWYDERLCFDTTHWQATPEPDCRCEKPPCKCVFLRGEDLVDFTTWMWIPETAVKALALRYLLRGIETLKITPVAGSIHDIYIYSPE